VRAWLCSLALLLALGSSGVALAAGDALIMGFYLPGIRDANLTDVRVSLQVWAEEVGRGYGLKAKAVMYDEMQALQRDALQGRVDIVIAPGMEIAENFTPDQLSQGFIGLRGNSEEGIALITLQQTAPARFEDLRGKRILRLVNDRLSDVFLETQCAALAASCDELFQQVEEKRDVQSVHKVFFGKADAALVRLSALQAAIEMNPQIGDRVRVLMDWKTISLSFGMMTAQSTPAFREQILKSALQVTQTVRGKQILELFKVDAMARVEKTSLGPYWRLQRKYLELKHAPAAGRKQ